MKFSDNEKLRILRDFERYQRKWVARSQEESIILHDFFTMLTARFTFNEIEDMDGAMMTEVVEKLKNKDITVEELKKLDYDQLSSRLFKPEENPPKDAA